jgi:hypothetical protein
MKTRYLLAIASIFILAFAWLMGCSTSPTSTTTTTNPMGTISFFCGKPSTASSANISSKSLVDFDYLKANVKSAHIYIDRIDISKTGETWESVLTGPYEVAIDYTNDLFMIGSPVSIPAGQYEGVKLKVLPIVTWVLADDSLVTVEATPKMQVANEMYSFSGGSDLGKTTQALFSTYNGFLTAFNVESGANTYLIFEASTYPSETFLDRAVSHSGWWLAFVCRATRFIDYTTTTGGGVPTTRVVTTTAGGGVPTTSGAVGTTVSASTTISVATTSTTL